MKNIEELYNQYTIMKTLRIHMYRVAGVASIICDHMNVPVDKKSVIEMCLLHDMGKIVEFDLEKFPEFTAPEGQDHWEGIKKSFKEKYNTDNEHEATMAIAMEVDANLHTLELLHSVSFSQSVSVDRAPELEKKICLYADMRVTPSGVLPLSQRLADLDERYAAKAHAVHGRNHDDIHTALYNIEKDIFAQTDITPTFINESKVLEMLSYLRTIVLH